MSEQTATAAIDVRDTSKIYGNDRATGVVALDQVSLVIKDNEFFTLLGPSGCGKTTLLRLIAGFEQPTHGEILLFGEHLEGLPPYKRSVNTVFQHYALFPHMTVAENISFGLEMLEKPASEIKPVVDEVLGLVQMEHLADRKTDQLSGGQQQRVALARALAPRPRYCCSTNRCRRSISSCARRCRSSSSGYRMKPALPLSSSPMTRKKRWRCPIASR